MAFGIAMGCTTTQSRRMAEDGRQLPAAPTVREHPALNAHTGAPVPWQELVSRAAAADAVLIGEIHGHPTGLAAAAALFQDVLVLNGGRGGLALEFLERDDQVAIDDYLAGVIDEAAFRDATGRTAQNYRGHGEMVEAAKGAGAPVRAANAPRRYVTLARTDGFDRLRQLTPRQRELFEIPSALSDGGYKERFFNLMAGMAGHGGTEAAIDATGDAAAASLPELYQDPQLIGFYRSQNMWDATMADTVADMIAAGNQPVFLVVGQFHIDFEGGTLQRLRHRLPEADILTVSMEGVKVAQLRGQDRGRADIVIYVGAAPPQP